MEGPHIQRVAVRHGRYLTAHALTTPIKYSSWGLHTSHFLLLPGSSCGKRLKIIWAMVLEPASKWQSEQMTVRLDLNQAPGRF
jgi:hypothetical protein